MTYMIILVLTLVVFLSRYLFLEPKVPLRLNNGMQRFLSYAGPAMLSAIWGPIVFLPHGELRLSDNLPYILGAIFAVIIARITKNILFTTFISIVFFMLIKMAL